MSIDTLWQSREPIGGDAPSARPQTKFEDYHADIVASLHKKGNTLQIQCASQNLRNTDAHFGWDPGVNPFTVEILTGTVTSRFANV